MIDGSDEKETFAIRVFMGDGAPEFTPGF